MGYTFIEAQTATGDSDLTFTLSGSYDEYRFECINMNPADNARDFRFGVNTSVDGDFESLNITNSSLYSYHDEADSAAALAYINSGFSLSEDSVYASLSYYTGNVGDESTSGELTLYAPGSDTFVKHWTSRFNSYHASNYTIDVIAGGYINTTTALVEVSFQMGIYGTAATAGGNFDGVIRQYGLS
jgi:hypothetical protein